MEVVFVGFAYADLPLGRRFAFVFPNGKPQDGVRSPCQIVAVTQQFAKPFPEVPHGWRTICLVHFPEGAPQLVRALPTVDGWLYDAAGVCVCDEETWVRLLAGKP